MTVGSPRPCPIAQHRRPAAIQQASRKRRRGSASAWRRVIRGLLAASPDCSFCAEFGLPAGGWRTASSGSPASPATGSCRGNRRRSPRTPRPPGPDCATGRGAVGGKSVGSQQAALDFQPGGSARRRRAGRGRCRAQVRQLVAVHRLVEAARAPARRGGRAATGRRSPARAQRRPARPAGTKNQRRSPHQTRASRRFPRR